MSMSSSEVQRIILLIFSSCALNGKISEY